MSTNEFKDREEVGVREALKAAQEKERVKKKKEPKSKGWFVQVMNGEFLSQDNFVKNLPFVFFLGLLLVVVIAWGYYAETVTKREVKLEKELGELNSEYFTLGSEFNSKRGRRSVAKRLVGVGVKESLVSPKKIKVKKYNFKSGE